MDELPRVRAEPPALSCSPSQVSPSLCPLLPARKNAGEQPQVEASSAFCPSRTPAPTCPLHRTSLHHSESMTYLRPQQMGLPLASRPPTARPRKEGMLPNRSRAAGSGPQAAGTRGGRARAGLGVSTPAPRDPPFAASAAHTNTHTTHAHSCTLTPQALSAHIHMHT